MKLLTRSILSALIVSVLYVASSGPAVRVAPPIGVVFT